MLRQLGCRAAVASGASEGLRALCEQSFDLVLMDIQMPGMDGVEVLRTFRRGPDARRAFLTRPDTPVVAVTANALDGDEQRFLDLGFDDYLSKPFRQSQLLAMLNHHLRPGAPLPGQDAPEAGSAPAAGAAMPAVLDAQALARLRELDPKGENRLIERVLKAFTRPAYKPMALRLIAAPHGRDGAVTVHQDVAIYASLLTPGRTVTHSFAAGRQGWLQVARGALKIGEATMQAGDGAAVQQAEGLEITATGEATAEFLLFDLA